MNRWTLAALPLVLTFGLAGCGATPTQTAQLKSAARVQAQAALPPELRPTPRPAPITCREVSLEAALPPELRPTPRPGSNPNPRPCWPR